jgi:hypothetical protein
MSSKDQSRLDTSSTTDQPTYSREIDEQRLSADAARARSRDRVDARQNRWVLVTAFDSGDKAYWGEGRDGHAALTPFRGNAFRYVSEAEARANIPSHYHVQEFTPVELPPKPSLKR